MARCKQHRKAAAKDELLQALLWACSYFRRPLTDPSIRQLTSEQILAHYEFQRRLDRAAAGLPAEKDEADFVDSSFDSAVSQPAITVSARATPPPEPIDLTDDTKWKDI